MPAGPSEVEKAFDRILVLKQIVRQERIRAENAPRDKRNVDLGIVEADQPHTVAKEQILATFNDLKLLLDHLHIAHMAASFETEALARLGTLIGEARQAVKKDRKSRARWPINLVRSQSSFEGLHDIEQVLALPTDIQGAFTLIRRCRNEFGHTVHLKGVPQVASDEAREILIGVLELLK